MSPLNLPVYISSVTIFLSERSSDYDATSLSNFIGIPENAVVGWGLLIKTSLT